MAATQINVHELGDFRTMPVDAWTHIYANFAATTAKTSESPAAKADDVFGTPMGANSEENPFLVPEDPSGTPKGPNFSPGLPLGFLTSGTPSPTKALAKVRDAFRSAIGSSPMSPKGDAKFEIDDSNVPMLEAVEPVFAGEIPEDPVSPTGSGSPTSKSEGAAAAWKKLSAAFPRPQKLTASTSLPLLGKSPAQHIEAIRDNCHPTEHAKQLQAHANKAKEQVSETVNKAKENALKVPEQVSATAQKGMGFVKGQAENVRSKVPLPMTVTAQKSFGFAKEKAGTARDKAQTVSAAMTAKVTQTTQKGMDIARGMRPQAQGKVGGA